MTTPTGAWMKKESQPGTETCASHAAEFGDTRPESNMLSFPPGEYGTIVVDPPWSFTFSTRKTESGNNGWHGSTDRHYATMKLTDLKALPVTDLAADDCVLWLWSVNALLDDATELMRHWGFDYKNCLTWAKTNQAGTKPAFGMGYWLRGASEHLLIGVRGKPKPLKRNVPTWFSAPLQRHSQKPDEAYQIIRSLSPGPHIDLFARGSRNGWDVWGDEATTPNTSIAGTIKDTEITL